MASESLAFSAPVKFRTASSGVGAAPGFPGSTPPAFGSKVTARKRRCGQTGRTVLPFGAGREQVNKNTGGAPAPMEYARWVVITTFPPHSFPDGRRLGPRIESPSHNSVPPHASDNANGRHPRVIPVHAL